MKHALWLVAALLVLVVPLTLASAVGYMLSMGAAMAPAPQRLQDPARQASPAPYDAQKPTVAIVLGEPLSEVTDVLGPYALFAESGAYNVYTVASTRAVRTLSGGLDVLPHYSFDELDALLGRAPAIVVVPALPDVQRAANAPVLAWLRQVAAHDSLLFSWCTGAEVLAASGVLDGRSATAHWGDIDRLERAYPQIRWQRGVRYVDEGTIVSSAGLTSGVDATLYLLARLQGGPLAERVAAAVHYPSLQFVAEPVLPQYRIEPADSIYFLNAAFYWPKQRAGVWLYDGVDELSLAAIFDVYTASWTNQAFTLSDQAVLTTRHGLQLLPRWQAAAPPTLDRLLVPDGIDGQRAAGLAGVPALDGVPITDFTTTPPTEFAMEAALEAFARSHDTATARFAAKRLEYRATSLELRGSGVALRPIVLPLVVISVSVGVLGWWRVRIRRS